MDAYIEWNEPILSILLDGLLELVSPEAEVLV